MSTLPRQHNSESERAVYVVQSGIVAWEEPKAIPDWTSKTVTVCAVDAPLLTALLRQLLAAEFGAPNSIFR